MKKSRCTEEQIAFALKQAEGGMPTIEVCRKMEIGEQTYFWWKKKFAGMGIGRWHRDRRLSCHRDRL